MSVKGPCLLSEVVFRAFLAFVSSWLEKAVLVLLLNSFTPLLGRLVIPQINIWLVNLLVSTRQVLVRVLAQHLVLS